MPDSDFVRQHRLQLCDRVVRLIAALGVSRSYAPGESPVMVSVEGELFDEADIFRSVDVAMTALIGSIVSDDGS